MPPGNLHPMPTIAMGSLPSRVPPDVRPRPVTNAARPRPVQPRPLRFSSVVQAIGRNLAARDMPEAPLSHRPGLVLAEVLTGRLHTRVRESEFCIVSCIAHQRFTSLPGPGQRPDRALAQAE